MPIFQITVHTFVEVTNMDSYVYKLNDIDNLFWLY